MPDIISGDVVVRSDSPLPPPEPAFELPMPSDTRASDAAFSVEDLGSMAEDAAEQRTTERDWMDQSSQELRQKRERDGDGLDGSPPVLEIKASRQDEPYSLRQAQKEYSEGHRLYTATAALANARAVVGSNKPVTDAEVHQYDRAWEGLQKTGQAHKPGEIPFKDIGLIRDDGREVPRLRDDQRVTSDLEISARQGAKLVGNFRDQQEALQNALVEHLQGEEVKRQIQEEAVRQPQQPPARPAPAQQSPRQVQPDPFAAQKAQLAARQAAMNLSAEQQAIVARATEWQNWARKIPELQSWEALRYTQQHDPKRHAQVVKALQAGKQFNDAAAQRFSELNELRQHRANQWHQGQAHQHAQHQKAWTAQREKMNTLADNDFNKWLAREHPSLANTKGLNALREHAKAVVKESFGISDAEMEQQWKFGLLRHPSAQRIIASAAVHRMEKVSRERLKDHRARVPQAMAPSAGGLRHNDSDADINTLQGRLEGQSGRNALMTAVELQKARRKAGR